jgi:hypothetical protein
MNIINKPDAPVRSEGTFQISPTFRERMERMVRRTPDPEPDLGRSFGEMLTDFNRQHADRMRAAHERVVSRHTASEYRAGQAAQDISTMPVAGWHSTASFEPIAGWVTPEEGWVTPEEVEETSRW